MIPGYESVLKLIPLESHIECRITVCFIGSHITLIQNHVAYLSFYHQPPRDSRITVRQNKHRLLNCRWESPCDTLVLITALATASVCGIMITQYIRGQMISHIISLLDHHGHLIVQNGNSRMTVPSVVALVFPRTKTVLQEQNHHSAMAIYGISCFTAEWFTSDVILAMYQ